MVSMRENYQMGKKYRKWEGAGILGSVARGRFPEKACDGPTEVGSRSQQPEEVHSITLIKQGIYP